ncbi:type VII secretion target [Streptomyces sp. NPDC001380]|uniref:type VII secretion target n=1 Tax=Streptomyces sp. NPDC001380 TaxID=3364566 RepID=UPI0036A58748
MPDIHIRPDTLRQSATGLRTVAGGVGPRAGHWLDASFAAALSHGGWESAGALSGCAAAWQDHMKQVVRQLHDHADRLDYSAGSYESADAEATRRLRQALTDLNAG